MTNEIRILFVRKGIYLGCEEGREACPAESGGPSASASVVSHFKGHLTFIDGSFSYLYVSQWPVF